MTHDPDKEPKHSMHLLGIVDQQPREASIENAIALTVDGENGIGPFASSIILVGHIRYKYTHPDSGFLWDSQTIKNCIDRAVIHELGHQRGGLTDRWEHPSEHDPDFDCVMDGLYDENKRFLPWYYFCNPCKETISDQDWFDNY